MKITTIEKEILLIALENLADSMSGEGSYYRVGQIQKLEKKIEAIKPIKGVKK